VAQAGGGGVGGVCGRRRACGVKVCVHVHAVAVVYALSSIIL
jgi:hypothetical protein